MTISQIGNLLRQRKISCVELLSETLRDIKRRDRSNSLITTTSDQALAEAAERDRELAAGFDRGPLHGVPTAYKYLFYTRGVRTTAGSLLFRDFVPDYDAAVVRRLRQAGAISVGKTNLHELAYGVTSKNPHYGSVLNPHDTRRIAGGSSGGSAALVSAGLVPFSLGTDTGGSIRIPASFCGVAGLKPTYGRVSRHGVLPLSFSLDHVGPLASCVEDCALIMNVIADSPRTEFNLPAPAALNGVKIGVPANFFFARIDPEVEAAVARSISEAQKLGATITEVKLPDFTEINAAARVVQLSETASLYAHYTDASLFGKDVWPLIQQGKLLAAHEYVNAQRLRTLYRRDFDALWRDVDVLLTPTTPIAAPLLEEDRVRIGTEEEDTRIASTRLVRGFNYLGEPALSLPCASKTGATAIGLPIGLQLITAPFTEPKLLQIAKTIESVLR